MPDERHRPGVRRAHQRDALGNPFCDRRHGRSISADVRLDAVSDGQRKRKLGRADRVLPGIWRLRLPLPWPGVPHVNAWALSAGDGIVLVDTGIHEEGALEELERALAQIGPPPRGRAAARLHARALRPLRARRADRRARRLRAVDASAPRAHDARDGGPRALARRSGSRSRARAACRWSRCAAGPRSAGATRSRASPEVIEPHRELLPGVEVETDHGTWTVHYTPGHAPSHVVLFQPQQRLLLSGDHLLGRVSALLRLRLDAGPRGRVPRRPRHGRAPRRAPVPTGPRPARSATCRRTSRPTAPRSIERLDAIAEAVAEDGEATAFDLVQSVFGEVDGMDDELGADDHALLPHPPRASGAGGAGQLA